MPPDADPIERSLIDAHRAYVQRVESTRLVLTHKERPDVFGVVHPGRTCRYTAEGRRYLRARIGQRIKSFRTRGVMVTLTMDPKRISRERAWECFGRETSRFLDAIRAHMKRRGRTMPAYLWAVEEQSQHGTGGTGYPHLHLILCTGWVAGKDTIARLWGHGWARVERAKSIDVRDYATKEVGKIRGWTARGLAYIWRYRRRIWACSQAFREEIEKREPEWALYGMWMPGAGFGVWTAKGDGGKGKREGFTWLGGDDWPTWRGVMAREGDIRDVEEWARAWSRKQFTA